jgi:hypothetical protein
MSDCSLLISGGIIMQRRIRAIRLRGLETECGTSEVSIKNFEIITKHGYEPKIICFEKDTVRGECFVKIYFSKNNSYDLYYAVFNGLNVGYWGEGCRAFHKVLTDCGLFDKETLETLITGVEENLRYVILLDRDSELLVNVHISKRNIAEFTYSTRPVKLKDKKPRIIKSWDKKFHEIWLNREKVGTR